MRIMAVSEMEMVVVFLVLMVVVMMVLVMLVIWFSLGLWWLSP